MPHIREGLNFLGLRPNHVWHAIQCLAARFVLYLSAMASDCFTLFIEYFSDIAIAYNPLEAQTASTTEPCSNGRSFPWSFSSMNHCLLQLANARIPA